jgi:hypothetical protein
MKKFSSLSCVHHMFYNLGYEFVILFFGVLFVEDAILFVAKSNAAETM